MYYSSEEYIEPDVVVIFGNDYEMLKVQNKDESIHSGRTSLKRSIFLGDFILHITHKNICKNSKERI